MFTLADITRLTGGKRRSVQLWAEAGALVADPQTERAGAGVHRSFDGDELLIACVLNAISPFGVTIGRLKQLSDALRSQSLKTSQREFFRDAVAERGKNVLIFWNGSAMFWSSRSTKHSLEVTLAAFTNKLAPSAIIVNLNACVAGAREALASWS